MINLIIYAIFGVGLIVVGVLVLSCIGGILNSLFNRPEKIAPLVQTPYWNHQSRLQYEAWARMDRENAKKSSIFQV